MARSPGLLLSVGLVVLIGIVVMTYILSERSRAYFAAAIDARNQRVAAVELLNALMVAESSQRGFIFSGNEVYLAPFDTAVSSARRAFGMLDRTAASSPDAAPLVARLRVLTADKLDEMAALIALKRAGREAEVRDGFATNRGKALMDEANIFLSGLILAADDRITAGIAEQRANASWLRWVTILGGLVIVAVVGFATASVMRQARDLALAHGDLAALNAGLEARVAARTADLAQANEEIQRFAYIVTHDLRAPLVNIMGFTSELEAGIGTLVSALGPREAGGPALPRDARAAIDEDLPEAIRFIRSSTKTMDDLIKAILRLAREGRRTLKPASVDIRRLVETAAAAVQHQIQSDGGSITYDIAVPEIVTDPMALEQVVGNLLDNAVKYRARNRPLRLEVRAHPLPGNRVAIEVEDNGRGIAAQDQSRVFELFRRAGALDQPGEGIGLAHVQSLLRRMGGSIAVDSVLDVGTTFTFILPIAPTDKEVESA